MNDGRLRPPFLWHNLGGCSDTLGLNTTSGTITGSSLLDRMPTVFTEWCGEEGRGQMLASVEIYVGLCFFSLIAFVVLASVAKLRPDLDEQEFDFIEFEKPTQLVNSEQSANAFALEPAILEESSWSPPRPVKRSKRLTQRRPRLISMRKPRTI